MPRRIYKPEEIIARLHQVEVLTSQGKSAVDAIRSIGVTDATFCPLVINHEERRMPAKRELTMRQIRYTLRLASEEISAADAEHRQQSSQTGPAHHRYH